MLPRALRVGCNDRLGAALSLRAVRAARRFHARGAIAPPSPMEFWPAPLMGWTLAAVPRAQMVRKPLQVRPRSRRTLDQRLWLRFPRLAAATHRLIARLEPGSR